MQQPAKPKNFRRIAWQLGLVAAALLICELIYKARQPIRLPVPMDALKNNHAIHNGEIFWTTKETTGVQVHAMPVTGGSERIVLQVGKENDAFLYNVRFTDTDLCYFIRPKPKPQEAIRTPPPSMMPKSGKFSPPLPPPHEITYLGNFRPAKTPPAPGEERMVFPTRTMAAIPFTPLFRVPRTGGQPKEVPGVDASGNLIIVGDWIYWIKLRPDETTSVQKNWEGHDETIGHSDLMATSLSTEETRKLASNLDANTFLFPAAEGVYWIELRSFPDPAQDLYHIGPTGPKTLAIPNFQPNGRYILISSYNETVSEYKGRLYWLEYEKPHPPDLSRKAARIVSANPEGSDTRTVLDLVTVNLDAQGLKAYRGNLYFFFRDNSPKKRSGNVTSILMSRLHPEQANSMEILSTTDAAADFDEGYCYFISEEQKRPLWDTLTGDDAHMEIIPYLHRMPLPN